MPRLTSAFVVVAALGVGGCDMLFDALNSPKSPPARACYDEALHCDVARGETCRRPDGQGAPAPGEETYDGLCVLEGARATGDVYFEFQPSDASVPRIQFGPIALERGQNQELTVPEPVRVQGRVAYPSGESLVSLEDARVRFKAVSLIPGRPLSFEVQSSAEPDFAGEYERLIPQGDYVVSVYPREREEVKPPSERPFGDEPLRIDAPTTLDLVVSNPNALVFLSGTVQKRINGRNEPAEGLTVWAMQVDANALESPRQGAGTPLGPTARTQSDGSFKLWFPQPSKATGPHRFRLEIGPGPDAAAFPTFRPERVWELGDSRRLAEPLVLSVNEEDISTGKVQGEIRGPYGQSLPGARITFRTLETEPFSYAQTVVSDDSGRFTAVLFAGAYSVFATPQTMDFNASGGAPGLCALAYPLTVARNGDEHIELFCQERVSFFGRVITRAANPVLGASVTAKRRVDELGADPQHEERTTDAEGFFHLSLTPGVYDFAFVPPAAIAPPKTIENVVVTPGRDDALVLFALDPPFELFGRLATETGALPLAGALEAWVVGADGQSRLVGRGIAQRDGAYSIVLPALTP